MTTARRATRRAGAGLLALVVLASGAAGGAEPRPLPALSLLTLEGATADRAAVVKAGHWLLVYVRPQSGPSRTLLAALAKARAGSPAAAIVVGSDEAGAKALAGDFPDLQPASWYADPRGEALKALALGGVPMVLGMNDDSVQWSLAGVAPDRKTLPSVLSSW
jgi:hypothetical protein